MTVDNIMYLAIVSYCALIMIVVGVVQWRKKTPAGFWAGVNPPDAAKITDVTAYNKKHGKMWIVYGLGMPLSYLVMVPFGNEVASILVNCTEICGGIIGMILYHNYLDNRYLKKD